MSSITTEQYPSPGISRNFSDCYTYNDPNKLILIMVGLPARGKTYIARKLRRYLSWLGFNTKLFNVGNYRRKYVGSLKDADFFDPDNPEGVRERTECAMLALSDMMSQLNKSNGTVAIYDGTNSTKSRRNMVLQRIEEMANGMSYNIVWIESICTDKDLIEKSIIENKLRSPDYVGISSEKAHSDFRQRIAHYEKVFETLDIESNFSYIKLINMNSRIISNRIEGYLPGKVLFYLANLKIHKQPIFITRHGESEYNRLGKIGGDSPLSENGLQYSRELAKFIRKQPEYSEKMPVQCSTLKRTVQTATYSGLVSDPSKLVQQRALSEIESGLCDGMTYKEIETEMPDQFEARSRDKYSYRYPRGESYQDVIMRLEPVIFELERTTESILIVCHRAVLRCLYAYFRDIEMEDIPHISIPLHTVFKLKQVAYGCEETRFEFGIDAVDIIGNHSRVFMPSDVECVQSSINNGDKDKQKTKKDSKI